MSELDYQHLEKSIEGLKAQYKNYSTLDQQLPDITKEAVKESTIKRFDICYDTLLKSLRKLMEAEGILSEDESLSSKKLFRKAKENGIITTELQQQFIEYIKVRNASAHSYSGVAADTTISIIEPFIEDVQEIYETLQDWE